MREGGEVALCQLEEAVRPVPSGLEIGEDLVPLPDTRVELDPRLGQITPALLSPPSRTFTTIFDDVNRLLALSARP